MISDMSFDLCCVQLLEAAEDMSSLVQAEDVWTVAEDELHHLVLVDQVDRHVPAVPLGPHQRRPEDDAEALRGHQVPPGEPQHAEETRRGDQVTPGAWRRPLTS